MKINNIKIVDVGGIRDLDLNFDANMNILCGPNGIGKTTILECCAHLFSIGGTPVLKSRVPDNADTANTGEAISVVEHDESRTTIHLRINHHEPWRQAEPQGNYLNAAYLLSLKTGRNFGYKELSAIHKDVMKSEHHLNEEAKHGVNSDDIKSWFINRDLFSSKEKSLSSQQISNFKLATTCFSKLNADFNFSHVEANTFDIYVSSPAGTIVYEYLSAGFKSSLIMMMGIIKELELRFPHKEVKEIEAVVLIDEIELHLHPEWQGKIIGLLVDLFPKLQFIVTTHSPHIIQCAARNQIIALERNGKTINARELPSSPYGFMGWTVDEVLTDVMGMPDTRSDLYLELQRNFNDALDSRDGNQARTAYSQLEQALHPNSIEAKLMRLQLISLVGEGNDQA